MSCYRTVKTIAAHSPTGIFDKILPEKAKLDKYLKENFDSKHLQELSFKYVVKPFSIPKFFSKVS